MRVYIHLGMHKTGSSLLQQRIFPKMKQVYYIPRGDSSGFKKYIQYTDDFDFDPKFGLKLFNQIPNVNKYDRILVSDEEFYGNPYWSNMDRKRNIDRIVSIFGKQVSFILFIRNQFDLINSLYNQYIKTGGTANFESFMNFNKYPLYVGSGYFCYDKYIEYIIMKVGCENFKLLLFEDFIENKVDKTNEILSYLGNKTNCFEITDFVMTNQALKNGYIPYLRFVNKFSKSPKNPFLLLHFYVQIIFRKLFLKLDFIPVKTTKFNFIDHDKITKIKLSNRRLLDKHTKLNLRKHHYPL